VRPTSATTQTVTFINWDDPTANDFALPEDGHAQGGHERRMPGLYVNGSPSASWNEEQPGVSHRRRHPAKACPTSSRVNAGSQHGNSSSAGNDSQGLR